MCYLWESVSRTWMANSNLSLDNRCLRCMLTDSCKHAVFRVIYKGGYSSYYEGGAVCCFTYSAANIKFCSKQNKSAYILKQVTHTEISLFPWGSSSSFVFGSGSSAPAAGPAFGAGQLPAFGQSQGSGQPNAPSFGSLSTTLFSAGSQPAPPAFGSVTSSTQPPVFGQQSSQQPGFGSGTSSTGECWPSSSFLVSKRAWLVGRLVSMKCIWSLVSEVTSAFCAYSTVRINLRKRSGHRVK